MVGAAGLEPPAWIYEGIRGNSNGQGGVTRKSHYVGDWRRNRRKHHNDDLPNRQIVCLCVESPRRREKPLIRWTWTQSWLTSCRRPSPEAQRIRSSWRASGTSRSARSRGRGNQPFWSGSRFRIFATIENFVFLICKGCYTGTPSSHRREHLTEDASARVAKHR